MRAQVCLGVCLHVHTKHAHACSPDRIHDRAMGRRNNWRKDFFSKVIFVSALLYAVEPCIEFTHQCPCQSTPQGSSSSHATKYPTAAPLTCCPSQSSPHTLSTHQRVCSLKSIRYYCSYAEKYPTARSSRFLSCCPGCSSETFGILSSWCTS